VIGRVLAGFKSGPDAARLQEDRDVADLVEIGAVWVRMLAFLPGLFPEPTHIVDQVLPLIVLDVGLLVRCHEPVDSGAVSANGLGVFAHCFEIVEVLLHGVRDWSLARFIWRSLRHRLSRHAEPEFLLAFELPPQGGVQVGPRWVVLGEELEIAADPQAVVVAIAALAGVASLQTLERTPRLAALSDVDAYLFDPHRFYPLKVNTR
jgi:hypothetical protein